jgi:hypothetical protein
MESVGIVKFLAIVKKIAERRNENREETEMCRVRPRHKILQLHLWNGWRLNIGP